MQTNIIHQVLAVSAWRKNKAGYRVRSHLEGDGDAVLAGEGLLEKVTSKELCVNGGGRPHCLRARAVQGSGLEVLLDKAPIFPFCTGPGAPRGREECHPPWPWPWVAPPGEPEFKTLLILLLLFLGSCCPLLGRPGVSAPSKSVKRVLPNHEFQNPI